MPRNNVKRTMYGSFVNAMSQKEIFLNSEGDAWFGRNPIDHEDYVIEKVIKLNPKSVLEIGCGAAARLNKLKQLGIDCYGIEPSLKAVKYAKEAFNLDIYHGTADILYPIEVDVVIFGFCLYLVDRKDLFTIASNTDKILNNGGYVVINDFKPPYPYTNEYKHYEGIKSYKMDYSKMFTWNPDYTLISSEIYSHDGTDLLPDNRVGIDIIMKG